MGTPLGCTSVWVPVHAATSGRVVINCQKCVVHCLHCFPSQSINPTIRESGHRGGPPSLGYSTVIFVLTEGVVVDGMTVRNRLSATCLDQPVCTRKASTTAAGVLGSRPWTRSSERIDFVLVHTDTVHAGPPTPPDTLRDSIASQHELRATTHIRCCAAATGRKHGQQAGRSITVENNGRCEPMGI